MGGGITKDSLEHGRTVLLEHLSFTVLGAVLIMVPLNGSEGRYAGYSLKPDTLTSTHDRSRAFGKVS